MINSSPASRQSGLASRGDGGNLRGRLRIRVATVVDGPPTAEKDPALHLGVGVKGPMAIQVVRSDIEDRAYVERSRAHSLELKAGQLEHVAIDCGIEQIECRNAQVPPTRTLLDPSSRSLPTIDATVLLPLVPVMAITGALANPRNRSMSPKISRPASRAIAARQWLSPMPGLMTTRSKSAKFTAAGSSSSASANCARAASR